MAGQVARGRPCGHPLCRIVGDDCSLATGLSRGCRAGPYPATPFEPALIAEVAELLIALDPAAPAEAQRPAASRLAALFRREARNDRSLLVLASDDDGELEPALRARLAALCRRRA